MQTRDSQSVVVGGGICGLFAALLLAEQMDEPVVVLEREEQFGGLLRSFDYGRYGIFDYGMHNMYETGIAAVDELLFGLLEEGDWQILEGPKRDIAGLYHGGRLQRNSPYVDLSGLPRQDWLECAAGLLERLNTGSPDGSADSAQFLKARFGEKIATAMAPALEKLFGKPANLLDVVATLIVPLRRVILFSEESMPDLMQSDRIRERVGFPDQRRLPEKYQSHRKAFYPKSYGMHRVVDALIARLRARGVELVAGASVKSVEIGQGRVSRLEYESGAGPRSLTNLRRLAWTAGIPSLAGALGVLPAKLEFDPPRQTVVVNLLLDAPPNMGDLYYFYCFEPGFKTLRVTNFSGYCVGAPREEGYPISVELLVDAAFRPDGSFEQLAEQELRSFGVLDHARVRFAKAEILKSGFPMPTTRNLDTLRQLRKRVAERGLANLSCLGILAEDDLFFQGDVLAHAYKSLAAC